VGPPPRPFFLSTLKSLKSDLPSPRAQLLTVFDGTRPSEIERQHLDELDARVTLLSKRPNLGQVLNAGLQLAETVLVSRIDSDDLWPTGRLPRQLAFMQAHPECIVAGSDAAIVDSHGRPFGHLAAGHATDLRRALLVRNQLIHPTTVFRTAVARRVGGYPDVDRVEDYALWLRLAQYGAILNCSDLWVHYRVHPHQLTQRKISRRGFTLIKQRRIELAATLGISTVYSVFAHAVWSAAQFGGRHGLQSVWTRFEREAVLP
jgi:hypothetical protein